VNSQDLVDFVDFDFRHTRVMLSKLKWTIISCTRLPVQKCIYYAGCI